MNFSPFALICVKDVFRYEIDQARTQEFLEGGPNFLGGGPPLRKKIFAARKLSYPYPPPDVFSSEGRARAPTGPPPFGTCLKLTSRNLLQSLSKGNSLDFANSSREGAYRNQVCWFRLPVKKPLYTAVMKNSDFRRFLYIARVRPFSRFFKPLEMAVSVTAIYRGLELPRFQAI